MYIIIESNITYNKSSSSKNSKNQQSEYYVDEHGKTSTEITKYGMIWLKETSDGSSAWYGIDNSDATFKIGSKFWVKWLSPKINRKDSVLDVSCATLECPEGKDEFAKVVM